MILSLGLNDFVDNPVCKSFVGGHIVVALGVLLDLFQRLEDDTWERSFEEHIERAYTPEELSGWLTEAGFAQIEQFGNLRLEAPENTELRIFFAAKKG